MNTSTILKLLFFLSAIGTFSLLVLLKRLILGNPWQKKLDKARADASARESTLWENFRKRDDVQSRLIKEQEKMISLLQEKLSVVENPELPENISGYSLVYEYDRVPIYVPDPHSFDKLEVGCKPSVRQDKGNQFDDRAVSLNLNGEALAYLHRGKFQDMANDFLDREDGVVAYVTYLNRKKLCGQILLGFYKNPINAQFDDISESADDELDDEE